MFDQLFKCPPAIARHSNAPYAEERRRYLAARALQGNSYSTLVFDAQDLLWVARKLSVYPDLHQVTMEQAQALAAWNRKFMLRSITAPGCPGAVSTFDNT